jgi:methylated-DNA-[protein]-cysteine S-methyltransferase
MDMTLYACIESPIGPLMLCGDEHAVTALYLPGRHPTPRSDWRRDDARFAAVVRQLEEYFAGERTTFDVPLRPSGAAFELDVWAELLRIPYGTTASYGEVARRVGHPTAARAVGAANGRNPIAIIVPCHRVIGSTGRLIGYGGGLDTKRALLDLEAGRTSLAVSA